MKIKVKPEDFIVEEIASLPLSVHGEYGVYCLDKSGWNTIDLLKELASKFKINFSAFSWGGRKDRHAKTRQYISIKDPRKFNLEDQGYAFKFLSRMNRPMGPDLIEVNKFKITIRDLKAEELKKAIEELGNIKENGFPNYFDDQRFGSFDLKQGFLGEKVLKKEFNGALKIYLTSIRPQDKKSDKQRKELFFKHWKDWNYCLGLAKTKFEKEAFGYLVKRANGFFEVLNKITREEFSTYFSCYQAYLWNEMLRRIVKKGVPRVKYCKGIAGDYIFCDVCKGLENLVIPVPGLKPAVNLEIYKNTLDDFGIKQSMFNSLKVRKAFFKSFSRQAIIKPEDLSFSIQEDDIYKNKKALVLNFKLIRGSYATMLIKRIFNA